MEIQTQKENIYDVSLMFNMTKMVKKFEDLALEYHELVEKQETLAVENRRLRFKLEQYERLKKEETENIENAQSTFKNEECVICYQSKPNILFCNCGHLCICDECDKLSSSSKCPVCRNENKIKRKIS